MYKHERTDIVETHLKGALEEGLLVVSLLFLVLATLIFALEIVVLALFFACFVVTCKENNFDGYLSDSWCC